MVKDGQDIVGNKANVKIVKNKVAPPFKSCTIEIEYGKGISHTAEVIAMGTELGVIEKSGSWYSYKGEKIGQGTDAVKAWLQQNEDMDAEITEKIKEELKKQDQD